MNNTDDTNVPVEDYLYALGQRNLVYNHDFRYFSNQIATTNPITYGVPDGWQYEDKGANGSISFDPGTQQCIIKKSQDSSMMTFKQAIHEFPRWQQTIAGKTVTAVVSLNLSITGDVALTLTDGIDSNTVVKNGAGDFDIVLQLNINAAAPCVLITIKTAVPLLVISLSKVYANVGELALPGLPCIVQGVIGERKQYIATETAPAEELSLCNAPVELGNDYSRLNSVLNKRFGAGPNGNSMLIDMRGYFSRAWDNKAGADPDAKDRTAPGKGTITGDHVSTFEQDIFLKHHHGLNFSINRPILTGNAGQAMTIDGSATSDTKDELNGKETRPKNIAELYTIKWA